jgi:DNA-binding NarL/FixJ family response regulator
VQAGATGYVLKDGLPEDLLEAIQSLYNGRLYFSRKIAPLVQPPYIEDNDRGQASGAEWPGGVQKEI